MKLLLIIALAALPITGGYTSGLMLDTGTLDSDWVQFFINGDISKTYELLGKITAQGLEFPTFIQFGELYSDQSPISSASVAFNIGVIPIIDNGKSSLQNVVDKCIFHSVEAFSPLCVICRISDMNGNVIGEGIVLEKIPYTPSSKVEILLTPIPESTLPNEKFPNDVQNVNKVEITVCEPPGGEGCTPGFWKQSQHFGSWTAPYAPTNPGATKYEEPVPTAVFTVSPSLMIKVGKDNIVLKDATLLQALQAKGGQVNALARHSAAALLNAASTANYAFTVPEVIAMVNAALASGDDTIIENTKNTLAVENEQGCPFGIDSGDDNDNGKHDEEQEEEHGEDEGKDKDKKK